MITDDLIPELLRTNYELYELVGVPKEKAKEFAITDVRRILANIIEAVQHIADEELD